MNVEQENVHGRLLNRRGILPIVAVLLFMVGTIIHYQYNNNNNQAAIIIPYNTILDRQLEVSSTNGDKKTNQAYNRLVRLGETPGTKRFKEIKSCRVHAIDHYWYICGGLRLHQEVEEEEDGYNIIAVNWETNKAHNRLIRHGEEPGTERFSQLKACRVHADDHFWLICGGLGPNNQ